MSQKKKKDQEEKAKAQQEEAEKVENSSAADVQENEEVADEAVEEEVESENLSDEETVEEEDESAEEEEEPTTEKKEINTDWRDKYMRLSAEFDNYRKRTLKEKTDLIKVANEDLLKAVLPVVDDFERGMSNITSATDIDAMKEGMDLIYNKFSEFLKQNGIKEIEAKEKEFDLDYHEALTKIPAPSEDLKGKVVDVIEKGYLLNDKVIRFAKVVVGD